VPLVSVVVPVYNGAGELPALLAALEAQTASGDAFEVLVVDDRSTDRTAEVVERSSVGRLLRTETRGGSYAARNLGIDAARGELLAFTDADCRPDPTWIERGIAELSADGTDLLGGAIEVPLGPRPTIAAMLDVARYLDQERYASQGFAATANLWARREAFDRFGRFNARLRAGGDAEFGKRAVAAGAKLRYAPDVLVRHPPRTALRQIARKGFRMGHGHAERVYAGDASKRGTTMWCTHPRMWLPPRRIEGLERLRRTGYEPRRRERAAMLVAQYGAAHLPMMVGNLKSVLEHRGLPRNR
jgi:glycosyltransferase involved in cell wall biosynthesis